jgi:hypothetical protein
VHALLAGWRVSLLRTRADWPIVAAAWLITLLAAVLLSSGPVYSSAAAVAGLRRTLATAPGTDTSVQISAYRPPADAAAMESRVEGELERAVEPVGGSIVRDERSSETLALSSLPGSEPGDQAILGFLDGLPDHASLVEGAWPAKSTGPSHPIQVVVLAAVAEKLRVAVGDELSLVTQGFDQTSAVRVRLVGTFAIGAARDPYWFGDQQLITGIVTNAQYRSFGPFLTTPSDFLQRSGVAAVHVEWHVFPNLGRLTLDDAGQLGSGLGALQERLHTAVGNDVEVTSGLPAILNDAERSLLVSRTGVLLLLAQLAILAAYAIVLTASLLVERRRIDTALLRSRGAGPWQVALLSLAEGLLLAVPAVLIAPWLAVAALSLFNVVGPLADVGLDIVPRVTADGYVAAGAIGVVCVVLLVLPALLTARGFAAEQRELSRQETRTFGQRMGIDVALLAVSAIALWQLRMYGAPLTRTVQGSLGLDPLLVAAPAIGLLAGGVVALRILPLLAQRLEMAISRGRGLIAPLGSRQLARRPLRYTRSALLLMLAMSMGVFALSYAATWSTSQRDQAEYQSGADLRVVPGQSLGGLPAWALPSAYAGLPDIEGVSPVERISEGVSFAAGTADLLAIDADRAAGVVHFRGDESAKTLGALMQALRAGRPEPRLAMLPAGATYLRIVPRLDIGAITRFVFDLATGEGHRDRLDISKLVDARIGAFAIVRDADGLLYRVTSNPVPMNGQETPLVLSLEPSAPGVDGAASPTGARLDGPIDLAGLGIDLWLPADTTATDGVVGVASVSAGDDREGPWAGVALASTGAWSAQMSQGTQAALPAAVPADQSRGVAFRLTADETQDGIIGNGANGPPAHFSFMPSSIAETDRAAPAIANRAFLAASGSAAGDTILATLDGAVRTLSIAGVVDVFPTTDAGRPLLVMDERTLGLLRLQATSGARNADEWWIAAPDTHAAALSAALRRSPFSSTEVLSVVERTRSLSTDGVALGIIGALTLGSVAAALFAIVGLVVSAAVSARERRTEFALLRALGLSGRQLSAWLWLENGSLVFVSLLAGTGLGLLIGWMVLPFVTVTQRATAPVPSVIVNVPWDRILLLEVVSALALSVAVVGIGAVLRRLGLGSILRMGED